MDPVESGERVVLAVVTRPHGLRGGVHAKVFNPETTALASGARLRLTVGTEVRRVHIVEARSGNETWFLKLEGCDSLEAAEKLRGAELWLPRAELPPPDEGEYYFADLVGCVVSDLAGATLGTVREVTSYPTVDALVLDDGTEIPIVDGIIAAIDTTAHTITVDRAALPER